jgi:hypothetical protein
MNWLTTLVEVNPLELIYRAATGTPSPVWRAANGLSIQSDIKQAGGTDFAATQAVNEVGSFLDSFWPARSPGTTLVDLAGGNPLGMPGQTNYTTLAVIVVGVVAVLLVIGYGTGGGGNTFVIRGARKSSRRSK